VQLERELSFHKLAFIETAQAVIFNTVAVGMAYVGCGAISFGAGLLARSVAGAAIANTIHPRCYGWVLDSRAVKRHLSFGVFYQTAQFFSLLKDSITPILVGFLVGPGGVGYVSWSMMLASYPVMALMVLKRIYLPMFARFQNDRAALAKCFELVVWVSTSISAPLALSLLLFVWPITNLVFGAKWGVAIPLFYWFWIANAFVPAAAPMTSLLNSLGFARLPTIFAFIWMAGTWLFGWPLMLSHGILGIALANALVQLANLALYRVARRHVPFRIGKVGVAPWTIAAVAAGPVLIVNRGTAVTSLSCLIALIGAHLLLYSSILFLVYRKRISRLFQAAIGGGLF
jgi:O-antigen/teichoic acid export membrane protein